MLIRIPIHHDRALTLTVPRGCRKMKFVKFFLRSGICTVILQLQAPAKFAGGCV